MPETWIDTHAHLNDEKFQHDLPAVLDRAKQVGIVRIVVVATDARSSQRCIELAASHPEILRASVGIQPNHVAQEPALAWDDVLRLADRTEVVALGETGLDRYWDYTPFPQQEDYFARHLDLSRRIHKPLIIHCRNAEADVVRMLRHDFEQHGLIQAVMHSFTGDLDTAQACLSMGLMISFAGMLTYKNAQALREVASKIPHDRLLVETDAPYLAPVPVRGKRNEPAHVRHTGICLADLVGMTPEQLATQTTLNARKLFRE